MPLYQRRVMPVRTEQLKGALDKEFQNVQRALHGPVARSVTMDTTVSHSDFLILADPTSQAIEVTFPDANVAKDLVVTVKQINSNANTVTLGGTFDGIVNPVLGAIANALTVQSDGTDWWVTGIVQ